MPKLTRRATVAGLLGVTAAAPFARAAAPVWNVPPEGVGRRIKHEIGRAHV